MAKKTRRQKQRTAARRPVVARPVTSAAGPASEPASHAAAGAVDGVTTDAPAPIAAGPGTALAPGAARRRVERIGPSVAASRPQRAAAKGARFGTAAAMFEPLDTDDPAIPFDRVPYVPADLRRVAVIAGLMVVLILIAWAIVSNVVS